MTTTARVNKLAAQLNDMVKEYGYIKTANALVGLYEDDYIDEFDCEHLRYLLSIELMGWNDELAIKLRSSISRIETSYEQPKRGGLFDEEFEARSNRQRLENNQLTKWVDSPIFDQPQPQLELHFYGSYAATSAAI